jgi:hypothetical protein
MASMKTLAKRLVRLEERLTPVDYARNPRRRHRLSASAHVGSVINRHFCSIASPAPANAKQIFF